MTYSKLEVLETIEAIRKRPGMYVSFTDTPIQLLYEMIDNALDEAQGKFATKVYIEVEKDKDGKDYFLVWDNGRGFPHSFNEKYQMNDIELAAMIAHSGAKFSKGHKDSAYITSTGLHGLGLVATNALSDKMFIFSKRESNEISAKFTDAILDKDQTCELTGMEEYQKLSTGTCVVAYPSIKYFDQLEIDDTRLKRRLALASTFIDNLTIYLNGEQIQKIQQTEILPSKIDTPMWKVSYTRQNGEEFLLYFGYRSANVQSECTGSVNLLPTQSGIHITVARSAVMEAFAALCNPKEKHYFKSTDYLCGLELFCLFKLIDPSFSSQTKEYLTGNFKSYLDVVRGLKGEILKVLHERPNRRYVDGLFVKFRAYRDHLNRSSSSRLFDAMIELGATDADNQRRRPVSGSKLIECDTKSRQNAELFLVEGDSAKGSIVSARDPNIHAVLPLRGKVLNVTYRTMDNIISNNEMRDIINALGVGAGKKEDPTRIRYSKVIIATDSDIDGLNIRALLIGAFCNLMPKTVAQGYIYFADTPLFGQRDKQDNFVPVWDMANLQPGHFERYKGLGSMDPDELAEVLLNKNLRKLTQITLNDPQKVINIVSGATRKTLLLERGIINAGV